MESGLQKLGVRRKTGYQPVESGVEGTNCDIDQRRNGRVRQRASRPRQNGSGRLAATAAWSGTSGGAARLSSCCMAGTALGPIGSAMCWPCPAHSPSRLPTCPGSGNRRPLPSRIARRAWPGSSSRGSISCFRSKQRCILPAFLLAGCSAAMSPAQLGDRVSGIYDRRVERARSGAPADRARARAGRSVRGRNSRRRPS